MPSAPRLTFAGGTLHITGMARAAIERVFRNSWIFDVRTGAWRCDAMHYPQVRADLDARCYAFDDAVNAPPRVEWPPCNLHPPRPEQQAAIDAWRATGRGVIVMPTGTGKTDVALRIMAECGVSTLVVAPVRDLMHQWHQRIHAALGYEAGIIGDGVHDVRPVSVTTYDSACLYMDRLGAKFGLVIFDECHHLPGPVRSDAARMCAAPLRLGLTATLTRPGGGPIELDDLIGPVVYSLPITQVRGSTLADYDIVRIPVYLTDEEQARYDRLCREVRSHISRRKQDDPRFRWRTLCREAAADAAAQRALHAFRAKTAIEDRAQEKLRVLEDLFRLHAGEPVLVFAGSNAMARDVSLRFLIPCLLSHSRREERQEVLASFASGEYPALVANRVLDEGVDLPAVKTAVVLGGSAGTRQATQRLGRVLRKTGDARAVLYEVVCAETSENTRSRSRRRNEAFTGKVRRPKRGILDSQSSGEILSHGGNTD